jgi:hypothetical protein
VKSHRKSGNIRKPIELKIPNQPSIQQQKTPRNSNSKKRSQEKRKSNCLKKIHDNTNIDYFYNSGIDYLSKCFLEIRKSI